MTDLLAERFAALATPADDSDWLDVRRRARGRGRRLVLPLAAAVAVLVVGSALALQRELVDFLRAEPAPERIVLDFGRLSVAGTGGRGPQVLPGEARHVAEAELGGKRQPLYVAPTGGGGFCWRWGSTGSCGRVGRVQARLGVTWVEARGGAAQLIGHLLDARIERLELVYEDGDRVEIPTIWVSPPIDAGFYAFDVPDDRQREGRRAAELVALDGGGDVLARHPFRYSDPRFETGPDGLPQAADRARKQTLFDFHDHRGERWTLVTAPAPGGRLCFAYDQGGGCLSPRFPATIEGMGVQGGGPVVNVCCAVAEGVAAVELRYEDGEREQLEPVDGFLLHVISPAQYEIGHRLERIAWLDAAGGEVGSRSVDPTLRGVYPCDPEDRIELGFGETICP
jgi:hypothetical protein